jgi:hypothetical protein
MAELTDSLSKINAEFTTRLNDTNEAQFCKWLSAYCKKKRSENKSYPCLDGEFCIFSYPDPSPGFQSEINIMATFVKHIYETGTKGESEIWEVDNAIKIAWLEVGENLKVTITQFDAQWAAYPVLEILKALSEDWPETYMDTHNHYYAKAKRYDIDLEAQPVTTDKEAKEIQAALFDRVMTAVTDSPKYKQQMAELEELDRLHTRLDRESERMRESERKRKEEEFATLLAQKLAETLAANNRNAGQAETAQSGGTPAGLSGSGKTDKYARLANSTGKLKGADIGLNSTGRLALDIGSHMLENSGNVLGQVVNPQQQHVRSQDIRITKRREKVKELSESGESVENIARNQSVSVATIVRDREYLGIATKREKPQP